MKQAQRETDGGKRRKNYPIRCIECGQREVRPDTIHDQVRKNHDGRVYELTVSDLPVTRCGACGQVFYIDESDDRIAAVLRQHLHLLAPARIRAHLQALNLSQKEAAEGLGVAPETLCRWLSGSVIQSRAMDNLLRVFFASPGVREKLMSRDPTFGETVLASPTR